MLQTISSQAVAAFAGGLKALFRRTIAAPYHAVLRLVLPSPKFPLRCATLDTKLHAHHCENRDASIIIRAKFEIMIRDKGGSQGS